MNKVIVFEEQEGDYKVHFEETPDLGMAADIQWLIIHHHLLFLV